MGDINRKGDTDVNLVDKTSQAATTVNADGSLLANNYGAMSFSIADKLYGVTVEPNIAASSATASLLLRNPGGSGKTLYLQKMIYFPVSTTAVRAIARMYKGPTVTTAGTSATVWAARFGGSPAASVATAFTLPTISANGTIVFAGACSEVSQIAECFDYRHAIVAGQDLLIVAKHDATNKPSAITLTWAEL